jgi:hypothetical protein
MKFTIGNVLGLCFSAVSGAIGPILAVTAIYYLGVSILAALLTWGLGAVGAFQLASLLPLVLTYPAMSAMWCAVIEIVLRKTGDKPVSISVILRNSVGNAIPVLLIGLVWFVGFTISFGLFIVPGIIFAVFFQVTVPAYIAEKTDIFGAFSRSRYLTRGHRWGLFGFNLLVNAAIYLATLVVFLGAGATGGDDTAVGYLALAIIGFILMPALMVFIPALNAAVYVSLRTDAKEPLAGEIAKVFE